MLIEQPWNQKRNWLGNRVKEVEEEAHLEEKDYPKGDFRIQKKKQTTLVSNNQEKENLGEDNYSQEAEA